MRRITLACLLVCLAMGGLVSPAQAQDSCAELNAFWDDKVYLITEDKMLDPHPTSKDFAFLDTSKFKWPDTFSCPSIHSEFASSLKLLFDFSHSTGADLNYYEWVRKIMLEGEYGFAFIDDPGAFASTNEAMRAVLFSPDLFEVLSDVTMASYIVHEAYHVDRGASHVVCDHGQLKGKRSCDEMFVLDFQKNSNAYSAQAHFLHDYIKWVEAGELRETAIARLTTIITENLNTLPEFGPDGVTPLRAYYGVE